MNAFTEFERVGACPVCESDGIYMAHQPDISGCHSCRVFFRNPRPTQLDIARSYNSNATFATWQEQDSARAQMWRKRLAVVQRFAPPRAQLLDVGTGDGRFLQICRAVAYEVTATEVSEAGANYARQRGFNVLMGQLTDIHLPQETFDVITIWHVLEHVPDPGPTLAKACSLLKPGGILACAVPNEDNFFFRQRIGIKKEGGPFAALKFGEEIHLTYFTPTTFKMALRHAGFALRDFGVDDVYLTRNAKTERKLLFQRAVASCSGWHFAVAMYAIAQKPK